MSDTTTTTTTTPAGVSVRTKGPTAPTVSRTLAAAGMQRSTMSSRSRVIPTAGFVVKGGDSAGYVTVFVTMHGLLPRCRSALEQAGFVVEDHPYRAEALAVYVRA